jgi:ATP adenylyltransferase
MVPIRSYMSQRPHDEPAYQPDMTPALHAPWRLQYLEALGASEAGEAKPDSATFLLKNWNDPARDQDNLVILRTPAGMILLNKFPYANGHLLVALGDPRPTLLDYAPAQRAQLWRLTELATSLMQRTLHPQGINIGINQGRAAGAGVPQHLHVHLVPRWGGDVNFIQTVGQLRIIPGSLEEMWKRYVEMWKTMGCEE